jgi:L-alanine-DL-glutamate epimerase-like enolase superfamily enzyme
MTIVHGGGITPLKKIAALAEIYHVRTGCHGATDLSPVAMAAALHFDISVSNFGIQEYCGILAKPMTYFVPLTISRMDICIRARSDGIGSRI